MYVPIMKNRTQELKVVKNFQEQLGESVVPLFEIIVDHYKKRYKVDSDGKIVMELPEGHKKRRRVELPKREEDLKTLYSLNEILNGKKAFVDFFRYTEKEYKGINIDSKQVELSFTVSRDYDLYRNKILEINNFSNLIPTISIKENFEFSTTDLISLISDLKINSSPIAIRITDDLLDKYSKILCNYLTDHDFIMLDIREQNIETKFMELIEFEELSTNATKILLNSPRLRERKNADYENLNFTDKINNSCATNYVDYNLDGFGDFGGLKDTLPTRGGGGGKGCALALIFLKENNQFFSVVNNDSSLGLGGYPEVVNNLLRHRNTIDRNNDCPIMNEVEKKSNLGTHGNWQSWTYYILGRYIYQQAPK